MEEDIDVFAELGVERAPSTQMAQQDDLLGMLIEEEATSSADPLAHLVKDAELIEALPAVEAVALPEDPSPASTKDAGAPSWAPHVENGVLALLVERGLKVEPTRLGLPAGTTVQVDRVTVDRQDGLLVARASLLVDGLSMHPFAAASTQEEQPEPLPAPSSLPEEWHGLHDALAACLVEGAAQLRAVLRGSAEG